VHVEFATRLQVISDLAASTVVRIGVTAVAIRRRGRDYLVTVREGDATRSITAKALVIATGRLWHFGLDHPFPTTYRRLEIGIRVEQAAQEFVFAEHSDLDPKWIYRFERPHREYRTFCCCRNGTIVRANTRAGTLLSGRADCSPTGRSNFGLMVRYLQPTLGVQMSGMQSFTCEAAALMQDTQLLAPSLGIRASCDLSAALRLVDRDAGEGQLAVATLHGPCLEGVGGYGTLTDGRLHLQGDERVWVVGDATGIFRGLVPSLVSGAYAGLAIASELQ
jgi:uncharacterized FAD-dependent dehydrogenase